MRQSVRRPLHASVVMFQILAQMALHGYPLSSAQRIPRHTHTHTPPMQYVQERAWSAPKPGGLVGRVSRCRAVQGTAPKSDGSDHDGSKVHGDSPPPAGVLFEASRSGGRLQGLRRPTISPPKHGCLPQQGLWYTLEGLFVQLLS